MATHTHFFLLAWIACCGYVSPQHPACRICDEWQWEKNDERHDFSLQISLQDGFVVGKHCYVLDYGNKIDCASDDKDVSFKIENSGCDSIRVNIRSYYSGATGYSRDKVESREAVLEISQGSCG